MWLVSKIRPETKWSNHEQVEFNVAILIGRPNPCMQKILGWFVVRGERPIKLRDSWFSAKSI